MLKTKVVYVFVQLTTFTIISWRKAHITVSLNIIPVVFTVYS